MLDHHSNQIVQKLLDSMEGLSLTDFLPNPIKLPSMGSWPESIHRIDKKSVLAIVAALTANRPLIVKGEPGVGKSQLARAAARLLERHFVSTVIQPHSEYQDLLWSIDHTARLGDAQLFSRIGGNNSSKDAKEELDISNYTSPGPLWWAFDWALAEERATSFGYSPEPQTDYDAKENGIVLLLDEIDKADLSLTNGLLEVLGNASFSVPHLGKTVKGEIAPLVIITSNDTRDLPKAFIRRCLSIELKLPKDSLLQEYFQLIGQVQFPDLDSDIVTQAAEMIIQDRIATGPDSQIRTGQAEFIDLLRALHQLPESKRETACSDLSRFFFKHERQG